MKKIVVSKNEAGQKLLKLLAKYLNTAPQSFLHKMLRKKNITLNGKKADGSELLCEKDEVCLFLAEDTILSFQGKKTGETTAVEQRGNSKRPKEVDEIRVLYEDDDVLILNNTKVFPARLYGNKEKTGARIEVFLLRELISDLYLPIF